jgi:hypothetical protein
MSKVNFSGENPFCTRRVRPGALDYFFPADMTVEIIVDRLEASCWRGEITGAHGSGKSTLLARLLPALERAGRQPVFIELHDGQRRLPRGWFSAVRPSKPAIIVVDGYEQLSRWSRFWLKRYCRRRQCGLLATAHQTVGLPEIFHTATSPELLRHIVDQLSASCAQSVSTDKLAELFARHKGDIREILFELYDVVESGEPE